MFRILKGGMVLTWGSREEGRGDDGLDPSCSPAYPRPFLAEHFKAPWPSDPLCSSWPFMFYSHRSHNGEPWEVTSSGKRFCPKFQTETDKCERFRTWQSTRRSGQLLTKGKKPCRLQQPSQGHRRRGLSGAGLNAGRPGRPAAGHEAWSSCPLTLGWQGDS